MMTRILLFVICAVFFACTSKCNKSNCQSAYDGLQFQYLNKNGSDLLFGSQKKYEQADLGLFSFDDHNQKVYGTLYVLSQTGAISQVTVVLQSAATRTFFEVKGVVKDTIDLAFTQSNADCCGILNHVSQITLDRKLIANENQLFTIRER